MMRAVLYLLLSVLPAVVFPEMLLPPTCGSPAFSIRIIGGMDADEGAWPWQVSVLYRGGPVCGGSLISDQWVLSAAHCFSPSQSPSQYSIYLGVHRLDSPNSNAMEVGVNDLIVHPQFSAPGGSGDIALIRLSRSVSYTRYIRPVCLPSAAMVFPPGTSCFVTGWGRTQSDGDTFSLCLLTPELGMHSENLPKWLPAKLIFICYRISACEEQLPEFLPYPKTLQQLMLPLIGRESCDQMYHVGSGISANVAIVKNDQICAGYQAGQRDACAGDSGGPLVCKMNGYWYQVGIVSWGEDCALPDRPGVYTFVPAYESWINSYISLSSSSSPSLEVSVLLLGVSLILHS
ncbi:serine protease 33-like [Dendrobates tinctorius]|uniref:serine protease 33-like n=1 Tax=Dendrobates tinctorius TaxID=92724 RepID=UPI003CCA14FD